MPDTQGFLMELIPNWKLIIEKSHPPSINKKNLISPPLPPKIGGGIALMRGKRRQMFQNFKRGGPYYGG